MASRLGHAQISTPTRSFVGPDFFLERCFHEKWDPCRSGDEQCSNFHGSWRSGVSTQDFFTAQIEFLAAKSNFWCRKSNCSRPKPILGVRNRIFLDQNEFWASEIEFFSIKTNFGRQKSNFPRSKQILGVKKSNFR